MSEQYTYIKNTLLSGSALTEPINDILLSGKDAIVSVDTSGGNETIQLSERQWRQGAVSYINIYNDAGANNINLIANDDGGASAEERAAAFQSVLGLTQVGTGVILRLIKSGAGTASVSIDGTEIISTGSRVGYALIQATNVTEFIEANNIVKIIDISSSGGSTISLADGTAADPSLSFASDPDTGLYRVGANDIGISTGGTQRLNVSSTYLTSTLPAVIPAGTAALPSISFTSDPNTGVYSSAADNVDIATGGTQRLNINSTNLSASVPVVSTTMSSLTNRFPAEYYIVYANSSSQSIPDNTSTLLTSTYWAGTPVSNGTAISYNDGVYTINQKGMYLFTANGYWASLGADTRSIRFIANDGQVIAQQTTSYDHMSVSGTVLLDATDTVGCFVRQASGGPINFTSSPAPENNFYAVLLFALD